jgi:hypothetical protein
MIEEILRAKPLPWSYGPERLGDIRHSCGDPEHMANLLRLGPFVPLKRGLSKWIGGAEKVSVAS